MKLDRSTTITRSASPDADFEFALSSEAPFERFFGIEILSHAADAVDLSRLNDGRHPLLLNHDTDQQIGVLDRAWLADSKVRVAGRWGLSDLAKTVRAEYEADIRTLVSVGYTVEAVQEMKRSDSGELELVREYTGDEFEREMTIHIREELFFVVSVPVSSPKAVWSRFVI